jgi:uncharacterized protein
MIKGYASIFDLVDRGGDIMRKGCFAKSLGVNRDIPLLMMHNPANKIGDVVSLWEDLRGLFIEAELALEFKGQKLPLGLSFGYRVRHCEHDKQGCRIIHECQLIEVSLVHHPMQPFALVEEY